MLCNITRCCTARVLLHGPWGYVVSWQPQCILIRIYAFERRVTWYFVWEETRRCSGMDNKHFITLVSMHIAIFHSWAAFSLAYGLWKYHTHSCNNSRYCMLTRVIRYIYFHLWYPSSWVLEYICTSWCTHAITAPRPCTYLLSESLLNSVIWWDVNEQVSSMLSSWRVTIAWA